MRVAVTGDFHGHLPPWDAIRPCDLLVYVGDLGRSDAEFMDELEAWLRKIPAGDVVAVDGNMDNVVSRHYMLPWTFLQNDAVSVQGMTVWGVAWQNDAEDWQRIPEDTEILVTHAPPKGYRDRASNGDRAGSKTLLRRALELPRLKLIACGHIHEAYGTAILPNGALVVNGAYNDRHSPIVVEL